MKERVQKLMAQAGIASRRESEAIIEAGRVRVNGKVVNLGDKADPATDRIEVDGRRLKLQQDNYIYIALNKPKGILSSLEDELGQDRRTIRDLINLPGHLYPVGRLDKQSEGLILITNNGDLAHKLTHPRYGHEKTYYVTVEGEIPAEALDEWRRGVLLDGRLTAPARIRILNRQRNYTQVEIIMREGRKRQIRRIASMLGYPVTRLVRQKIGPLALGSLRPGEWRYLTPAEVAALRKAVQSKPERARRPNRRRPSSK